MCSLDLQMGKSDSALCLPDSKSNSEVCDLVALLWYACERLQVVSWQFQGKGMIWALIRNIWNENEVGFSRTAWIPSGASLDFEQALLPFHTRAIHWESHRDTR